MDVKTFTRYFYLTVAQAISPTPDALLDAVIARTVQLADEVDSGGDRQVGGPHILLN